MLRGVSFLKRTCTILKKNNICTLKELLDKTKDDLAKTPQFGQESLINVIQFVHRLGYRFKNEKIIESQEIITKPVSLSTPFSNFANDFSVRTYNCLCSCGLLTLGDLVLKKPEELLEIQGFGQASLQEVEAFLKKIGYPPINYNLKEEARKLIAENQKLSVQGQKLDKELAGALETLQKLGVKNDKKVK